jgi:transcriptional regulator with XRE-family HTH domain
MGMITKEAYFDGTAITSQAEERLYAREELIYNATEDLLVILEDKDITKVELARRLGKSKSYITQLLSGSRNMTLGSLSDICFALEISPKIYLPVQSAPSAHQAKPMRQWSDEDQSSPLDPNGSSHGDVLRTLHNVIHPKVDTWANSWAA